MNFYAVLRSSQLFPCQSNHVSVVPRCQLVPAFEGINAQIRRKSRPRYGSRRRLASMVYSKSIQTRADIIGYIFELQCHLTDLSNVTGSSKSPSEQMDVHIQTTYRGHIRRFNGCLLVPPLVWVLFDRVLVVGLEFDFAFL